MEVTNLNTSRPFGRSAGAKHRRPSTCPSRNYRQDSTLPSTPKSRGSIRRQSSSRLERLATPSPRLQRTKYSLEKKNVASKDTPKPRRQRRKGSKPEETRKPSKSWKDQLSPKLNRLLKSISPPTPSADQDQSNEHKVCPQSDWDIDTESPVPVERLGEKAPGILSDGIVSAVINHPYESSCPPASVVKYAVHALEGEVTRLYSELEKLEMQAEKGKQGVTAAQCSSQALSPEFVIHPKPQAPCSTRDSIESLGSLDRRGSFGELVLRLTGELDSKIEEIQCLSPPMAPLVTSSKGVPPKQLHPQVSELVSSLGKLKQECEDLRRSSVESIQLANDEHDLCTHKLMSYVQEEIESVRNEELGAAEAGLCGASRLDICQRCKQDMSSSTIKALQVPEQQTTESQPSPLPTLQSWTDFCARVRRALGSAESGGKIDEKTMLDRDGLARADSLLRELSFNAMPCDGQDEVFVDSCEDEET